MVLCIHVPINDTNCPTQKIRKSREASAGYRLARARLKVIDRDHTLGAVVGWAVDQC